MFIPPKGPAENFGHSPHDVTAADQVRNDAAMMDARKWRREVMSWVSPTLAAHGSDIARMCLAAQIQVAYLKACGDPDDALAALAYMVASGLLGDRTGSQGTGWDDWAGDMERKLGETP